MSGLSRNISRNRLKLAYKEFCLQWNDWAAEQRLDGNQVRPRPTFKEWVSIVENERQKRERELLERLQENERELRLPAIPADEIPSLEWDEEEP